MTQEFTGISTLAETCVVLVNPPMRSEQVYGNMQAWGSVSPPTGLCYIAAMLEAQNCTVVIVDAEALRLDISQTIKKVASLEPDVVGIACKTLWIANAHRVASGVKQQLPNVPIVAGGNHVTALPERSLIEYPSFDIIVVGEGEHTFSELVHALIRKEDLKNVNGLVYRENERCVATPPRARVKNLDELPPPAFHLLPPLTSHYKPSLNCIQFPPAFSLVASRGCTGKCTFCDRKVFGNRVTFHSAEYTMKIIEDLYYNHGIRFLLFDDDNLLLNKTRAKALFQLMEDAPFNMPFTCQSRVDTISEEMLTMLKRAGCFKIMFGIESGSQQMLDRMKKKIRIDQIRDAVSMTRHAGILPSGYFILGHPGETIETLEQTVSLIRECDFFDIAVMLFSPLPGSEVYDGVAQFGTYNEDWERTNSMDQTVFIPDGLTEPILNEYMNRCYKACLLRPSQLFSLHKRFSSMAHVKALISTTNELLFAKSAKPN